MPWALEFIHELSLRFSITFSKVLCRRACVFLGAWPTRIGAATPLKTAKISDSLVLGPRCYYLFICLLGCCIECLSLHELEELFSNRRVCSLADGRRGRRKW